MNRQQIRRAMRKQWKRNTAAEQRQRDADTLAAMREKRAAYEVLSGRPTVKKHPGLLVMTGRPYKKAHGKFNRRILSETVEVIPAVTAKVGRKTVTLSPAIGYENTFHATKGRRVTRMSAAALERHLEAA